MTTGSNSGLSSLIKSVLAAGFTAGSFDLLAASVIYSATPYQVMKSISGGWYGKGPKGVNEALVGAASHYVILTVAAAVYAFAALRMPVLWRRPFLMGSLFGAGIFCFMHFVVLPLTPLGFHMKITPLLGLDFLANVLMSGAAIALIVSVGVRTFRGEH